MGWKDFGGESGSLDMVDVPGNLTIFRSISYSVDLYMCLV